MTAPDAITQFVKDVEQLPSIQRGSPDPSYFEATPLIRRSDVLALIEAGLRGIQRQQKLDYPEGGCVKCQEPKAAHGEFGFRDHEYRSQYDVGFGDGYSEASAALARQTQALQPMLGQLRHAYQQLVSGNVKERNHRQFADGLLAPQIRALEAIVGAERATDT